MRHGKHHAWGRHGHSRDHLRSEFPEVGAGFGGFGGFGPGGRGGRGRRRKLWDSDELRLVILELLAEEPRHGYDLIRALEKKSGGAYAPSPGVIYPQLSMLADEGLIIEAESDGARKPYKLTEEGAALRDQNAGEIAALFGRLDAIAEKCRHSGSEPARRAMHNLRNALSARLSREGADEELVFKAVAIIDSAAQEIERL